MITFRHFMETVVFWYWIFLTHKDLAPRRGEFRCFIPGPDGLSRPCSTEEAVARTKRGLEFGRIRERLEASR